MAVDNLGATQQLGQGLVPGHGLLEITVGALTGLGIRVNPGGLQAATLGGDRLALVIELLPALVIDQAELATGFGQTQIGVVLAQDQAILGAAGKHAIGLGRAHGDQVIHQYTQVGLVPARIPLILFLRTQSRVDPGQQALGPSFFIAGGAVDLAGEIQALDKLGFQGMPQVLRIQVIVFDGVTRTGDMSILKAGNGTHRCQLNIERQAC